MMNGTEETEFDILLWSEFLKKQTTEKSHYWTTLLGIILMFIIFFVSLIGNLLTCVVIYYDKTMHTATNYYLFNLAVSDLIVTFAILLEIQEQLVDVERYGKYQFGRMACKIHFFSVVALWNNSILIMTALAIERYIAIWYPLLLKSTPVWKRVMKIIALLWTVAVLETLPEVWTVELVTNQKSSLCYTVPTPFARVINGVLALVTFVIPLGIMTFVYGMIAFKVSVNQRNNTQDKVFNHRNPRSKVNKLIALTLSFLLCWLPFFTVRVLIFAYNMRQLMEIIEWWVFWNKIILFTNWFSVVLNPLLFSLMSTKFRKSLKAMWKSKFKKQHSRNRLQYV